MSNNQLGLFKIEKDYELNQDDLDINSINKMMERLELAKLCISHKQHERGKNNLLLVKRDINKLVKSLKDRS